MFYKKDDILQEFEIDIIFFIAKRQLLTLLPILVPTDM